MSTTPVLHQPTVPEALSEEWWAATERTANRLAKVSWTPEAFRGKPADIMAAGLALATIGRDLTPMTLKLVYVVKGTVDFMVDLIVAQVHAHGHEIWVVESDETHATVAGQRRGSQRVHEATFTIDDAKRANLVGKDVWKQYVKDMLVARAAKRCAKKVCPEALLAMPPPLNYAVTASGRIQVANIVHDQDDDIVDGELVDPETGEVQGHATAAPPGPVAEQSDGANLTSRLDQTATAAEASAGPAAPAARSVAGGPSSGPSAAPPADGRENAGGEEPVVGSSPAAPGPVDWREVAKAHGVTVGGLLIRARTFAEARGLPWPSSIEDVTDEQVVADVLDWLGEPA